MKNVVFVAPYFLDATQRFLAAAAACPQTRLGLVSCDPVERLDHRIRQHLSGHWQVPSIQRAALQTGVEGVGSQLGSVDAVLGMLEQIQVPLGEIRDRLGIPGMNAETANNFRDKSRMKNLLQAAGLPCARHRLSAHWDSAESFVRQCGYPIVIKPPDGAGAKGTFRCESDSQLQQCWQRLRPQADSPVLLEEFITGQEHSFDSVFVEGQSVWSSISHYFPGPLDVVQNPWIQWCVIIPRESDAPRYRNIQQVAPAAIRTLGMHTGLSHLEWFLRPDESVAISEVGARPPGAQFTSLLSFAHDRDFYRAWAELMIHGRFQPPVRRFACGAAYLRAMGQGRIKHVHGLQQIHKQLGSIIVEAQIPQTGQAPSETYEGEGYIMVRHPQTAVVEEALEKIISTIRVEVGE